RLLARLVPHHARVPARRAVISPRGASILAGAAADANLGANGSFDLETGCTCRVLPCCRSATTRHMCGIRYDRLSPAMQSGEQLCQCHSTRLRFSGLRPSLSSMITGRAADFSLINRRFSLALFAAPLRTLPTTVRQSAP